MAIDYEKLGKRIKHFREQKGISQDELGNLVWVNNVHISNIETGKKAPSIDLLIELANALGISTDDLLVDSLTFLPHSPHTTLYVLILTSLTNPLPEGHNSHCITGYKTDRHRTENGASSVAGRLRTSSFPIGRDSLQNEISRSG